MTLNERIAAVHAVLVGHEKHADVAKQYRVKPPVIGQLVFKAKKHKAFLEELLHKEQEAMSKRQAIAKAVTELNELNELNEQGAFIGSAASVVEAMEQEGRTGIKGDLVRKVMKQELGMSYAKIQIISWQ